jgi:hypothetical protein
MGSECPPTHPFHRGVLADEEHGDGAFNHIDLDYDQRSLW